MNFKDLYWLAGLLEGEGSFTVRKIHGGKYFGPRITLCSTDLDVVQRAAKIMKINMNKSVHSNSGSITPMGSVRKTAYSCDVFGKNAIGLMMTLYSLMSKRRRERIKSIILEWQFGFNARKLSYSQGA